MVVETAADIKTGTTPGKLEDMPSCSDVAE